MLVLMLGISPHIKIARETPRSRRHVLQHLLQAGYPAFQRGLADLSVLDEEIDSLLHGLMSILHFSRCSLGVPRMCLRGLAVGNRAIFCPSRF
jgi:hypothetical protein